MNRKTGLTKSRLFVFEVVFEAYEESHPETDGLSLSGRSVIVEIEPDGMAQGSSARLLDEAARRFAEEAAHSAALQTVQKDFPEGFEPACSVTQIGVLPDELRRRPPTLQTSQARAWLV